MDLKTIDTYLKLRALAEAPGDANERRAAGARVAVLEGEHPGIRAAADRVRQALLGSRGAPPPVADSGWADSFARILGKAAQSAASGVVDAVADTLENADRFSDVDGWLLTEHECREDQVCLEIRVEKRVLRRDAERKEMLRELRNGLMDLL